MQIKRLTNRNQGKQSPRKGEKQKSRESGTGTKDTSAAVSEAARE